MISIIAGKHKGRKLNDIKKLHVRPTQAKVRKSIFQILEPFDNLEVLDIYAGVGTLGIEAISRGASKVVFVEKDRKVCRVLQKNLELLGDDISQIIIMDAIQYLSQVKNQYFDIIFADPPYSKADFSVIKNKIKNFLKPGGIFCMEMKKQPIEEKNIRVKHYGSTQVIFWRYLS